VMPARRRSLAEPASVEQDTQGFRLRCRPAPRPVRALPKRSHSRSGGMHRRLRRSLGRQPRPRGYRGIRRHSLLRGRHGGRPESPGPSARIRASTGLADDWRTRFRAAACRAGARRIPRSSSRKGAIKGTGRLPLCAVLGADLSTALTASPARRSREVRDRPARSTASAAGTAIAIAARMGVAVPARTAAIAAAEASRLGLPLW
jgi:hypothetical protein